MTRFHGMTMGLVAMSLVSGSAAAQDHEHVVSGGRDGAAVDCRLVRMATPEGVGDWGASLPLAAARSVRGLSAAPLPIAKGVAATLIRTPSIRYAAAPTQRGGPSSYGGMFRLVVKEPGTYRVALGAKAWVDILDASVGSPGQGIRTIASIAHEHGAACTGIRKIVDFPLPPGLFILQVAGSGIATLPLMIVRKP